MCCKLLTFGAPYSWVQDAVFTCHLLMCFFMCSFCSKRKVDHLVLRVHNDVLFSLYLEIIITWMIHYFICQPVRYEWAKQGWGIYGSFSFADSSTAWIYPLFRPLFKVMPFNKWWGNRLKMYTFHAKEHPIYVPKWKFLIPM